MNYNPLTAAFKDLTCKEAQKFYILHALNILSVFVIASIYCFNAGKQARASIYRWEQSQVKPSQVKPQLLLSPAKVSLTLASLMGTSPRLLMADNKNVMQETEVLDLTLLRNEIAKRLDAEYTRDHLRNLAKELCVPKWHKMNKAELIDAIIEAY